MTRKEQETLFEKCRTYRRFCRNRFPKDFFPIWWELPIKGAAAGMDRCCPFMQRFLQRPLPLFCPIFIGLRPCLRKSVRLKKRRNRWPSLFLVRPKDASPISLIDAGIAVDSMAYCAMCEGVGSAILAALDRAAIQGILDLEKDQEVFLCLALGIQPTRAPWSLYRKAEPLIIMWMKKGIILFPKRTCPMS